MVGFAVLIVSINFSDVHSRRPSQKSTKVRYREDCHFIDCSVMFRNTEIWSQHDLFGLNPVCSFLSSASTWCFPLSKIALKNLLIVGKGVIPRQFLYSVLSPIF